MKEPGSVETVNAQRIVQEESDYPTVLQKTASAMMHHLTWLRWAKRLICSIQCPGCIVIKAFDAIRALCDTEMATVGGFLSPMEQDCLDILLRGRPPIILCPARGLKGLRRCTSGSLRLRQRQNLDRRPRRDRRHRCPAERTAQGD